MIQGKDKMTLSDFKLISVQTARQILGKFVKNPAKYEVLSAILEDNVMSTFQLRDILTFNHDFESLKSELERYVTMCKDFKEMSVMDIQLIANKQILKNEEDLKKAEQAKKVEPPSYDIKQLLTENNLTDAYTKVEELNIDQEAFWALDDKQIKEVLGVESFGERKNLVRVMDEIKKKHTKDLEEINKALLDDTKIDREQVIQLVQGA